MKVCTWDQMWGAVAYCGMPWSFTRFDSKDVFHSIANIVESEIHWGERFFKEISECKDHVMGEGIEEAGACYHGGDGWFPQLF